MRQLKIIKSITSRDSDSLDKYLAAIARIPRITPDQEVELAKKIQQGDQEALEKLVEANLLFVVSVAKQYHYKAKRLNFTLQDIINEGNLGLTKAAHKFDHTRGFKFISYAVWWVRQAILASFVNEGRIIKLPMNRESTLSKMFKAISLLEQELEREPTPEEIAVRLDMSIDEVELAQMYDVMPSSIDAAISSHEEDSADFHSVTPGSEFAEMERKIIINPGLREEMKRDIKSMFPERDAQVLLLFFGLEGNGLCSLNLDEIGIRMDLTRERVRQIKEKCVTKLTKSDAFKKKYREFLN